LKECGYRGGLVQELLNTRREKHSGKLYELYDEPEVWREVAKKIAERRIARRGSGGVSSLNRFLHFDENALRSGGSRILNALQERGGGKKMGGCGGVSRDSSIRDFFIRREKRGGGLDEKIWEEGRTVRKPFFRKLLTGKKSNLSFWKKGLKGGGTARRR